MIDVYLAIPYTNYSDHEREWIFETANRIAFKYFWEGKTVISPITHCHPIAKYGFKGDFSVWREFDMELLKICSSVVVVCIEGWELSTGIKHEIEYAQANNIPVYYIREMI